MTLFAWLCLAHFVGDWMLQNDWMARNKGRQPVGMACLLHCLIYTAAVGAIFVTAGGSGRPPLHLALFLLLIFGSHWAIDGGRLAERWGTLLHQTDSAPVRMVVDQTMHIVVLAMLCLN